MIDGIDLPLPAGADLDAAGPGKLKRFEDALDSLICAWTGVVYLAGRCQTFGDCEAAIWTP